MERYKIYSAGVCVETVVADSYDDAMCYAHKNYHEAMVQKED